MAYQVTNRLGTTLNQLIVVAEDRVKSSANQPGSVLIAFAPQLANGATLPGIVEDYMDLPIVVSFEADGVWYQYDNFLNETITIEKNPSGQAAVASTGGTGGVMTALSNDYDIKHQLIRVIPSSPAGGVISLRFDPYEPKLTLDPGTDEKTFWFVVDGSAPPWGVTLEWAKFSYASGANWNGDALDQVLGKKGVGTPDATGRTLFYSIPDSVIQALKDPNDARFKEDPKATLGALTLEYTLGVDIDPEVEMEGPGTGGF